MLVDFSRHHLTLDDPDVIRVQQQLCDLLYDCVSIAVCDTDSNVYAILAPGHFAGAHPQGINCPCTPDEYFFGVQPFFSEA